jgi:hypothetical protein
MPDGVVSSKCGTTALAHLFLIQGNSGEVLLLGLHCVIPALLLLKVARWYCNAHAWGRCGCGIGVQQRRWRTFFSSRPILARSSSLAFTLSSQRFFSSNFLSASSGCACVSGCEHQNGTFSVPLSAGTALSSRDKGHAFSGSLQVNRGCTHQMSTATHTGGDLSRM